MTWNENKQTSHECLTNPFNVKFFPVMSAFLVFCPKDSINTLSHSLSKVTGLKPERKEVCTHIQTINLY